MRTRPERPEGWVDKDWSREERWGAEIEQQARREQEYARAVDAFLLEVMLDVLAVLRGADLSAFECEQVLNGLCGSILGGAREMSVNKLHVEPSF